MASIFDIQPLAYIGSKDGYKEITKTDMWNRYVDTVFENAGYENDELKEFLYESNDKLGFYTDIGCTFADFSDAINNINNYMYEKKYFMAKREIDKARSILRRASEIDSRGDNIERFCLLINRLPNVSCSNLGKVPPSYSILIYELDKLGSKISELDRNSSNTYESADDVVTEGANIEVHKKMRDAKKEYKSHMKKIKSLMKAREYSDAHSEISKAINFINIMKEETKAVMKNKEISDFTALKGLIIQSAIECGKILLVTIVTGGLGTIMASAMIGIKDTINYLSNLQSKKGDVSAADYNMYYVNIMKLYDKQIKTLKIMDNKITDAENGKFEPESKLSNVKDKIEDTVDDVKDKVSEVKSTAERKFNETKTRMSKAFNKNDKKVTKESAEDGEIIEEVTLATITGTAAAGATAIALTAGLTWGMIAAAAAGDKAMRNHTIKTFTKYVENTDPNVIPFNSLVKVTNRDQNEIKKYNSTFIKKYATRYPVADEYYYNDKLICIALLSPSEYTNEYDTCYPIMIDNIAKKHVDYYSSCIYISHSINHPSLKSFYYEVKSKSKKATKESSDDEYDEEFDELAEENSASTNGSMLPQGDMKSLLGNNKTPDFSKDMDELTKIVDEACGSPYIYSTELLCESGLFQDTLNSIVDKFKSIGKVSDDKIRTKKALNVCKIHSSIVSNQIRMKVEIAKDAKAGKETRTYKKALANTIKLEKDLRKQLSQLTVAEKTFFNNFKKELDQKSKPIEKKLIDEAKKLANTGKRVGIETESYKDLINSISDCYLRESPDNEYKSLEEEIYNEGANTDVLKKLKDSMKVWKESLNNTKTYIKKKQYRKARSEIDKLIKYIKDIKDETEKIMSKETDSVFTAIKGFVINGVIDAANILIVSLVTLGFGTPLASAITLLKNLINIILHFNEKLSSEKGLVAKDFNLLYINTLKVYDTMIELLKKWKQEIDKREKDSKSKTYKESTAEECGISEEAANIDPEIQTQIDKLNKKGYVTKYSSPGHDNVRIKPDSNKDGAYYGKLYNDARIMFADKYDFPEAPEGWFWRQVDGKSYLDIKPKSYNKDMGNRDEVYKKWKDEYMNALDEWIDKLPDNTEKKSDDEPNDKDTENTTVKEFADDFLFDLAISSGVDAL